MLLPAAPAEAEVGAENLLLEPAASDGAMPHTRRPLYPGPRGAGKLGRAFMEAETKYAKSGDVHIAYRVFGNGPRDVILVPGTVSHVELYWELPANEYLLKRLASFSRVIVFDKRGQGLSDRVADQTLEERVGDLLAVMNAAGSDRATVYGWSEGGQMSLMLAATYPERVSGLVLYGTYASIKAAPWAVSREQLADSLRRSKPTGVKASSSVSMRRAAWKTRRSSSGSADSSAPWRVRVRSSP